MTCAKRFALIATLFTFPATASADIISGVVTTPGAGTFTQLFPGVFFPSTPANTVGMDNFQKSTTMYGFNEAKNFVLGAPLTVDLPGGSLPAGSIVSSHFVFVDPLQDGHVVGSVTFDEPIVAIIVKTSSGPLSDFLGAPGITYLTPAARGLEPDDAAGSLGNTLFVDLFASSPGDYIRVLTQGKPGEGEIPPPTVTPVPEPTSVAIFAVVSAALVIYRRRDRR